MDKQQLIKNQTATIEKLNNKLMELKRNYDYLKMDSERMIRNLNMMLDYYEDCEKEQIEKYNKLAEQYDKLLLSINNNNQ